ncbi:hypothetical protein CCR85_03870 [Rhodothalassium salexigens]|uniref:DEAD/DEAH box helicase n=1 Tax=Rhodothalassium salexigens TaxID=1086 RepID=UPI001913D58C|nr:DEAD/DEAH box helicase [Rhodothalassium salexigens]MBK5910630.1 hypothetical protein [Rhodothalassium salexigens]MBK5920613.1 hypothetical protein [Rhodothalassium salexigens]
MTLVFQTRLDDHGAVIGAGRKRRLRSVEPRPVADWAALATPEQRPALLRLEVWLQEETRGELSKAPLADLDDEARAVRLSHEALARLSDQEARVLALPPATPLGLKLDSDGTVFDPGFRVETAWSNAGGIKQRVRRQGALLIGATTARLPWHLFRLAEAAELLAAPVADPDARTRAYAALCDALPERDGADVTVETYLRDVRVFHAAAFSLCLGIEADSLHFDPVLFGREAVSAASGETSQEAIQHTGDLPDEEEAALLPPRLAQLFARDRFRRSPTVRSAYVLENGTFVIIDPDLKPALEVVRETADADRATRRQFIANPQGFLKRALSETDPAIIDRLFIETEQYSERVVGVDVWRATVLPWVKRAPNSWLPERFGLRIGDRHIELDHGEAVEALARMTDAKAAGETLTSIKSVDVPVTEATETALHKLVDLLAPDEHDDEPVGPGGSGDDDRPDPRFLVIQENLSEVTYEALSPSDPPEPVATPVAAPASLRSSLKTHQQAGLDWLARHLAAGTPGVLLADDMGLGKTLQALAFLAWARAVGRLPQPVLIVAPTGLLDNWRAEMDHHFVADAFGDVVSAYGPGLKALRSVSGRTLSDIKTGTDQLAVHRWAQAGIVLTTYETLRDYHFSFAKTRFSVAIFDEVQKLKNPVSQLSRAARALNIDFKLALTGTPVENSLQDLWSIMDLLWPGLLGSSKGFAADYPEDDPDRLGLLHDRLFEAGAEAGPGPLALRRMKADGLDGLPTRTAHRHEIDMPDDQAAEYSGEVAKVLATRDGGAKPGAMLVVLQRLRNISLHPCPPAQADTDLAVYAARSARFQAALTILDRIAGKGEKALVFLESREMQPLFADLVRHRYGLDRLPQRITGEVPGHKRRAIVDMFQARPPGFDVLILSPKAGGVGLTITAANHVIHLSRWWNPAVEDQSNDRVYRIGQRRPVHIHYPLAVHPDPALRDNSFDLRLDALLAHKRTLSTHMLAPPDRGEEDARSMYGAVLGQREGLETNL